MSTVTVKNVEINQPTLDEDGNTVIGGVVTIAFSPYAIITAGKAAKMTPSEMEEVARALFSHPDSIQHHVATELISEHIRVQHDHDRLVRELDVLINGESAAQQASLCDIVAQVRSEGLKAVPAPGWTGQADADAALVMLDRIDTTDSDDDCRIEEVKSIIRRLVAAPAPAVPEGWKLVPIEPTPEMCDISHVGVDVCTGMAADDEYYSINGDYAGKVYRAMLAAAPAPGSEPDWGMAERRDCERCGAERVATLHDKHGDPLCGDCYPAPGGDHG